MVDGANGRIPIFRPLTADDEKWSPVLARAETAFPLVLLAIPALLTVFGSDNPLPHRLGTLALAGLALVWTLGTDSWQPALWRGHPAMELTGFAGSLTLATLLMLREPVFLVFTIAAFFLAMRLRPYWLLFAGLALASFLIHTAPHGSIVDGFTRNPWIVGTVVLVQALSIGGGTLFGERLGMLNESRRRTLAELESAMAENAELHKQLLGQARETGARDERERLAAEIHDTLAQGFAGIVTQLQAAEQADGNRLVLQRHLATAAALARENLAEARRSVRAMSPQALESTPLPDALTELARRWSARHDADVECTTTGTPRQLHPELEATLLRVSQEALSNVHKHANAGRVGLTLSYMDDQISLDVRDDGVGFAPDAQPADGVNGGYGLAGMRRRVQRLAGRLSVESEPGGGTAVSASMPAVEAPPEVPPLAPDALLAVDVPSTEQVR